jgi:hypothetical protein
MQYSTDMTTAPKDGERFVALVPTGESDAPISEEMAYWDGERFEGEWRHVDAPLSENDPIAWLALPSIPGEIFELAEAA